MTDRIPPEVWEAAKQRSEARAARDWSTADRLRAEIEVAGWRVVDSGTAFRLEQIATDVEVDGEIRYGSSGAVPSRLEDPATGLASVIIPASSDAGETRRALDGLTASAPAGVDVTVVADGLPDRALVGLRTTDLDARDGADRVPAELLRTSASLGVAAAINAGLRRARAEFVIVLDPSVIASGDVISPLVSALADPSVAIAGPFGFTSPDLRRLDEVAASGQARDATAIQGALMAFRRADAIARGPLDEGFRFFRNLDLWWSLVLRDEGEGVAPRRAVVVPELPLARGESHAWTETSPAERERLSKRNAYRVLDRFRTRLDLALPQPDSRHRA